MVALRDCLGAQSPPAAIWSLSYVGHETDSPPLLPTGALSTYDIGTSYFCHTSIIEVCHLYYQYHFILKRNRILTIGVSYSVLRVRKVLRPTLCPAPCHDESLLMETNVPMLQRPHTTWRPKYSTKLHCSRGWFQEPPSSL